MINFFKKLLKRKLLATVLGLAVVAMGYFAVRWYTGSGTTTRYVTVAVEKGTLVVAVTGSGQVSAENQIDLKPKVSGEVVYLGVGDGDTVRAGALIAQLDARDAQKAVRDAQANLESAQLSFTKLRQAADTLSLTQAQNALASAQETKTKAEEDLKRAYDDGFSAIANAFLDLPGVMAGLQDVLYSNTLGGPSVAQNINYYANAVKDFDARVLQYKDDADAKYQKARSAYDTNFQDYKTADRTMDPAKILALVDETYQTAKTVSEAVKSVQNLIQFYEDRFTERNLKPVALADTHLASLNTYTGKTNTAVGNLLAIRQAASDDIVARDTADRTITEKTQSLEKLKSGADPIDVQSAELAVTQRENALQDAKEKLSDYFLRAPFDGIVAKINVKKADTASAALPLATLVTTQQMADISLNEVDVAKVKTGEKATLTFDAIQDLSIAGHVATIDTVGTVAQGVVTYNVKVALDTQDKRIKPGMSVSAAIVTDVKQNVLVVPNSSMKSQGNAHYVEVLDSAGSQVSDAGGIVSDTAPRRVSVEIGLENDDVTEITSGLKEGDVIVERMVSAPFPAPAAGQTSGLRLFGGGGGGGGIRGGGGGGGR